MTRSISARLLMAGAATVLAGSGLTAAALDVGGAGRVTRLLSGSPTANAVVTNLTPNGIAVDAAGNLFVSDAANHVVDEITPLGAVSVVAGTPGTAGRPTPGSATASHLGTPAGLAVGANQQLYIADPGNAVIEAVDLQTGALSIVAGIPGQSGPPTAGSTATSSELYFPTDVAFDGTNLYIADALAEVVEAVDVTASRPTLSIAAGQEDTMLPPNCTPQLSPPFVQCSATAASRSGLVFPEAVAVSGGNLYIADTGEHVIEEDSGGTITVVAGVANQQGSPASSPPFGPKLGDPTGLAVDGQGNLYIADPTNSAIEELSNGNLSVVAGVPGQAGSPTAGPATSSKLDGPGSVAIDSTGDLYIGDTDANLIDRVSGGTLSLFAGTGTGVACPFSSPLQTTLNADITIPAEAFCSIAGGGHLDGNVTIDGGRLSLQGGSIQGDVTVENTPLLAGALDTSGGTITGAILSSGSVDLTAGTTVTGNLESSGGTLAVDDAVVNGDVETSGAISVSLFGGTTVHGNVEIQGTKTVPTVPVTGCSTGTLSHSTTDVIGEVTVGGNLQVIGNDSQAPFDIADCAGPVTVTGDLQVTSNAGPVTVGAGASAANVHHNLVVEANTGGGEVLGNQVGGICQIYSNQPTIGGAATNTVQSGQQTCSTTAPPAPTPPAAPPSAPTPPPTAPGSSGRVIVAGPDLAAAPGGGYWLAAPDGAVTAYGGAQLYGSAAAVDLAQPIASITATPDGHGYWLVGGDGGVFAYGDAHFYGSAAALHLRQPIVGIAATPDGHGYWLVGGDGGVFAYGDARFYGSTGNIRLNRPVVGIATTADGNGYWLVASDGGVFTYGDASFYGSTGNIRLDQPIIGAAPSPDDGGYWLLSRDGGVFAYGDARFHGSLPSTPGAGPAAGLEIDPAGTGYRIVTTSGDSLPYPG